MTIGRTDDPENLPGSTAFEAADLFGTGSRTPSGPAALLPRQQAGHMTAIEPPVRILVPALEPKGPSTHDPGIDPRIQATRTALGGGLDRRIMCGPDLG